MVQIHLGPLMTARANDDQMPAKAESRGGATDVLREGKKDVFDRVDYAWRVHDALDAWTSKVDSKASIVLAIETAVLSVIVSLTGANEPLSDLQGLSLVLFRLGIGLVVFSIVATGGAVIPQLRRRASQKEWTSNSIYFGHLRHWDPVKLAKSLRARQEGPSLDELARQHVRMAEIAWRKHSLLQLAMVAALLGVFAVYLSATW